MSKDTKTPQDSSLENFSWDNAGSADFFGVPGTAITKEDKDVSMEEIIKQVKEEDDEEEVTKVDKSKEKGKEKKPAKEEKKEKEEEDDEEEEDNKSKEKKEKIRKGEGKEKTKKQPEDDKTDGQFFKRLAVELKENGIFQNIEIPEDKEELTPEEFFALQDEEVESRVNETFEAFATEMDDDGKSFIKFKKNGGRTVDFVDVFVNSPLPDFGDKEFDPKNETHRKVVLETYLTLIEKLDDEELSDRMEWLKENGKDQSMSEKYYAKLADIDAKQKTALLKQQEDAVKKKEEDIKKFNKVVTEALTKADSVGKFKITKEDKKKLGELITKPTVKVGKNKYIPSFHSKLGTILRAETPESVNKLLLLAKLIENNFDIKDIVTKVETEVVSKVKSKLRDVKNGIKPSSSGSHNNKTLSDFFE